MTCTGTPELPGRTTVPRLQEELRRALDRPHLVIDDGATSKTFRSFGSEACLETFVGPRSRIFSSMSKRIASGAFPAAFDFAGMVRGSGRRHSETSRRMPFRRCSGLK